MDEQRQSPEDVRRRLVEISDELAGLDSMAFAEKHALNLEGDQLRNELSEMIGSEMDQANSEWAERAGRKGAQNIDQGEASRAAIVLANAQQGAKHA